MVLRLTDARFTLRLPFAINHDLPIELACHAIKRGAMALSITRARNT